MVKRIRIKHRANLRDLTAKPQRFSLAEDADEAPCQIAEARVGGIALQQAEKDVMPDIVKEF
jgi:hypothetical protein